MKSRVVASALAMALLFAGVGALEAQQGPCDTLRERWADAFTSLQQAVERYDRLKQQSVEPGISEQMTSGSSASIARAVQAALEKRKRRMTEAETELRRLADDEILAFREWNDCNPGGRWAKAGSPAPTPRSVANQRRQLKQTLDDLLLDEAYLQYKHTAPQSAPEYSDYNAPGWQ